MMTLDEIKKLMAAGETAEADEALKELLEKEPNNLQAKMLYGTCRQLLGDEETFKRIHDDLAPVMERLGNEDPKTETVSLWGKYQRLFDWLIVAGLFSTAVGAAILVFGPQLKQIFCPKIEGIGEGLDAIRTGVDPVIHTCCAPNPHFERKSKMFSD